MQWCQNHMIPAVLSSYTEKTNKFALKTLDCKLKSCSTYTGHVTALPVMMYGQSSVGIRNFLYAADSDRLENKRTV